MELNFTKFFDVKSPIGIEQREKEDLSIGIDLFMPNPTEEFFNQILNANKEKYFRLKFIENDGFIIIDKGNHKILIRYNYRENEYNIMMIFKYQVGLVLIFQKVII